jgi:hypothetical protein
MWADVAWALVVLGSGLGRLGWQQQLEPSESTALAGMKQTESANSMHTPRRYVLQESTKKLVGCQGHRLAAMVATVTVGKGNRLVIAVQDCLVGQCRAVHVASKILQDALRALNGLLGERYPALAPGDLGKAHGRQCPSSQCQLSTLWDSVHRLGLG